MSEVSFEGIGAVRVSFYAEDTLKAGQAVAVTGERKVGPCGAGKRACGVAVSVSTDGYACVQVGGMATVSYSGTDITTGWVELTGDGAGGVKKAAVENEKGTYLVLSVDTVGKTAVICL